MSIPEVLKGSVLPVCYDTFINNIYRGYSLYYNDGGENKTEDPVGADTKMVQITGLSPNTKYTFYLSGYVIINDNKEYGPPALLTITTTPGSKSMILLSLCQWYIFCYNSMSFRCRHK